MKAVIRRASLPTAPPQSPFDGRLPVPDAGRHDLLVEVHAVSLANGPECDVAGVVRAMGEQASRFNPGDRVMYAGAPRRLGANGQLQLVDERLVGHAPASIGFEAAASLPLAAVTAWELLFERLQAGESKRAAGAVLLVLGADGGVGAMLIQLARRLTALTIVATASGRATQAWVRSLGAHHAIDHTEPLPPQLRAVGLAQVDYVASLAHEDRHLPWIVASLAPCAKLALVDYPAPPIDRPRISLRQGHLLTRIGQLVDSGVLRSPLVEPFGAISAANLRRARAFLESGSARGKVVLSGF